MSVSTISPILQMLRGVVGEEHLLGQEDEDLLQRFLRTRDEAAFGVLLKRHGPMVLDVCQAMLPNPADAEDAFQATFLVLAQKARSLRLSRTLGGWLHGVAAHVALQAQARFARRRQHEASCPPNVPGTADVTPWSEARQILHEELAAISDRLRLPLVLCYLEGRTQDEAAALLQLSVTTLKRRLESGRAVLRQRLMRRGLGSSGMLLFAAWPQVGRTSLTPPLLQATARAAVQALSGERPSDLVSAHSIALVKQATATGALSRVVCVTVVLLGLASTSLGLFGSWKQPKAAPALTFGVQEATPTTNEDTPGVDRQGDPLPTGAVARLGTQRFRSDSWVGSVTVVPAGKQLLGSGSQSVLLWDATTGRELRRFTVPRWRNINGGGFGVQVESHALSPDGKTLAVGTQDGSKLACPIYLFDFATGTKKKELPGHAGSGWSANRSLAFLSPDLLASAGSDGTVRLWDQSTQREVRQMDTRTAPGISRLLASSDSTYLHGITSSGKTATWVRWEVATGKVVLRQSGLAGTFASAALSPDDRTIAITLGIGEPQEAGGSNEVRLYSTATGKQLRRWRSHQGSFPQRNSVAFSPDGATLATGGADQLVRRWNLDTGKEIGQPITPHQYANHVRFLDSNTLITSDAQSVVKLWDARSGKPRLDFIGSEGHLTTLDYSPDGRHVAAAGGGGDASIRVWEAGIGKLRAHLRAGMSDVTAVRFSPDGKLLASADSSGVARVWDWKGNREILDLPNHKPWLHAVEFSPSGKALATGDSAGVIRIWDSQDGRLLRQFPGNGRQVTRLLFSRDGGALFSSGWDHSFRRWDLATGKQVYSVQGKSHPGVAGQTPGHTNVVTDLALSPGGHWLYSASYDHTIRVWDARDGEACRTLKSTERGYSSVNAIALSPDGTWLAAALGDDGQEAAVHIWDILTGRKVTSRTGHRGKVTGLVYSRDGKRLASCSTDTTILVWDVESLAGGRKPDPVSRLADLWEPLGSEEAGKGYEAVCQAVLLGEVAVRDLRRRLLPARGIDNKRALERVKNLEADAFAVRERASQDLLALGLAAEPILRKAEAEAESAEARERLRRILGQLATDQRRQSRCVEILEMLGDKGARGLLESLASGAPEAALTKEAASACQRLQPRQSR